MNDQDVILKAVCQYYMIEPKILFAGRRFREHVLARSVLFYLCSNYCAMTQFQMAVYFQVNSATVCSAMRVFKKNEEELNNVIPKIERIIYGIHLPKNN